MKQKRQEEFLSHEEILIILFERGSIEYQSILSVLIIFNRNFHYSLDEQK